MNRLCRESQDNLTQDPTFIQRRLLHLAQEASHLFLFALFSRDDPVLLQQFDALTADLEASGGI